MGKTFTLKLFDQNDQASFAQAVEIAFAQSRVELRTPGAPVQEPRRGLNLATVSSRGLLDILKQI